MPASFFILMATIVLWLRCVCTLSLRCLMNPWLIRVMPNQLHPDGARWESFMLALVATAVFGVAGPNSNLVESSVLGLFN